MREGGREREGAELGLLLGAVGRHVGLVDKLRSCCALRSALPASPHRFTGPPNHSRLPSPHSQHPLLKSTHPCHPPPQNHLSHSNPPCLPPETRPPTRPPTPLDVPPLPAQAHLPRGDVLLAPAALLARGPGVDRPRRHSRQWDLCARPNPPPPHSPPPNLPPSPPRSSPASSRARTPAPRPPSPSCSPAAAPPSPAAATRSSRPTSRRPAPRTRTRTRRWGSCRRWSRRAA